MFTAASCYSKRANTKEINYIDPIFSLARLHYFPKARVLYVYIDIGIIESLIIIIDIWVDTPHAVASTRVDFYITQNGIYWCLFLSFETFTENGSCIFYFVQ